MARGLSLLRPILGPAAPGSARRGTHRPWRRPLPAPGAAAAAGSGAEAATRAPAAQRCAAGGAAAAASAAESEAPANPVRRLRREAEHGVCAEPSEADSAELLSRASAWDDDAQDMFLQFYDEKVKAIQTKAGDKDHVPISGNLYMYRSIAKFGDTSGLFQDKIEWQVKLGLWIVIIVQTIGPVCILSWAVYKIEISEDVIGFAEWQRQLGLDNLTQRLLGVFFLVLFILNGSYALASDREETEKMVHMCKVFKSASLRTKSDTAHEPWPQPEPGWLWLGAFINSFCLIACALCMCLLFVIAEDGPKDVLFDAFGLTFLYNLDDIGGDLGFLDSKWDADQMGDIYGLLADQTELMEEIKREREADWTPDNVYQVAQALCQILLVCLPLTFVLVECHASEEEEEEDSEGLRSLTGRVAAIEAALVGLRLA